MTSFHFLVNVDVDRESGKFAPRDEMSEIIVAEIEQAAESAQLSGIGADGNSEYVVQQVEVSELDNKALRAIWKNNEHRVAEELPGDQALRNTNKRLRKNLKDSEARTDRLQAKLDDLRAERKAGKTTIWHTPMGNSFEEAARNYIPDGEYDRITFSIGDGWEDTIDVHRIPDGIEVCLNAMGSRDMVVKPRSGNVVRVEGMVVR